MAVIEEDYDDGASSTSHENIDAVRAKEEPRTPSTSTPLDRLLRGKQKLVESDLEGLLASIGHAAFLEQLCTAVQDAVAQADAAADRVDIRFLERACVATSLLNDDDRPALEGAVPVHGVTVQDTLNSIYDALTVPARFMVEGYEMTPELAQMQSYWRAGSTAVLQLLDRLLALAPCSRYVHSSIQQQARLLVTVARFEKYGGPATSDESDDGWTTPLSSTLARTILSRFGPSEDGSAKTTTDTPPSRRELAEHILAHHIKPLFSKSPHPHLHPDTARKLSRIRGGDLFSGRWTEDVWKGKSEAFESLNSVGCWRVVQYAITLVDPSDMEQLWPMLVPPLLTMLDDHEIKYRHQGVIALQLFLQKVPAILLARTGLDELIQRSLTTTYSFTSSPANIPMLEDAVRANLALVRLLYPSPTEAGAGTQQPYLPITTPLHRSKQKTVDTPEARRFDALSSLYHNTVINLFTFSSSSVPYTTLAYRLIPLLVRELGKGSIRYLSDTLPVLCTNIGGSPASKSLIGHVTLSEQTLAMNEAGIDALVSVIQVCHGTDRMQRWRGMVLSALATLWCNLREGGIVNRKIDTSGLERKMRRAVDELKSSSQDGTAQNDVERVLSLDPALFGDLLG